MYCYLVSGFFFVSGATLKIKHFKTIVSHDIVVISPEMSKYMVESNLQSVV